MSRGPRSDRRTFLLGSAASLAVAPATGAVKAAFAPSDRVRVAIIGCGMRGGQLLADMPPGAEVVVAADCSRTRAEALAAKAGARAEQDYRRVLDRRDIDGVIVCATDAHHIHASVLACQAGLDAYVEKPLSVYVREGRKLVDAARRYQRIVQTGSQQRSMAINRYACELVRDGGIGEVRRVDCVDFDDADPFPAEPFEAEPVPPGLDWDLWQGPVAERPYNAVLARHWRDGYPWWGGWQEYGGGRLTGLGSHAFDMVQYALGKDDTGPTRIHYDSADDGRPRVSFQYEGGPEVHLVFADSRPYRGPRNGAVFVGSEAKVEINRNKVTSNPPELTADAPPPSEAVRRDRNSARAHLDNWLDCIRSRKRPRADAEVGHRTASLCHLIAIAKRLRRGIRWDPVAEEIVGDEEAATMLDRPRRVGWELPTIG